MDHPTLSPDLPITSKTEDRLNRSSFASALASAIKNWNQTSSLVIALYGDWGSGKSSVKNMVLESLACDDRSEDRITVVEFNPWQINNQDSLSRVFFDEIGSVLGKPRHGEAKEVAEKRAAKWKSYSTYLSLGSSITKSLQVLLPLAGIPVGSVVLEPIAQALEKSSSLAKEGSEGVEAEGKAAASTLQMLKQEVAKTLSELRRPLLVVLDDVDRLAHDEIRILFQLIKANADFPNIIYLVLAQRETVVKALEPIAPSQGEAFLEKIIQVGLNVPQIGRRQLEEIFFTGLDQHVDDPVVGKRFDKERWIALYKNGIEHFFINLRDVNRYLSSLGFHVGVFRSGKSFEVNPTDLIAVETLRVFVPNLYNALPSIKHILTDEPRFMRKEEQKQDAAAFQNIFASVPEEDRESSEKIIRELFPLAANVLDDSYQGSGGDDQWFPELRIASHKVFDRYFHFGTPPGDLAQGELDEVISLAGDRNALSAKLNQLESRGLLDVLLNRLDSYKEKVPIEHALPFITSLFDLEVNGQDEFLSARFSPRTHIDRIVLWYLRQEADRAKRRDILIQAIKDSTGLTAPVSLAARLDRTPSRQSNAEPLIDNVSDIADIRLATVDKIRTAAQTGRLANEKEIRYLVGSWDSWGPSGEAKAWLSALTSSVSELLRFLAKMKNTTRSYSGASLPRVNMYYELSNIEAFLPIEDVIKRVDALDVTGLSQEDAENIDLFKKGVSRKNRGLNSFDIMNDESD
jgi:predicted KAP-like P-loop ATPase